MKTMHISSLTLWDLGKGKGRVSTYLPLKALCDRGHEVLFLTSNKDQEEGKFDCINVRNLKAFIPHLKMRYLYSITNNLKSFFTIFQDLIIALKYKPDIIYAHGIYLAIPAFFVSKIIGSRYIFKAYGVGQSNVFKAIFICGFGWLRLPADLYIITNDGTSGKGLAEKYGVPPNKLCFWVNGIDKDWANKPPIYKLKEKLSPHDEKIVLSVCRLTESKQVDILIKAIPEVVKLYEDFKFVIVGDGGQRTYLESMAKKLGIYDFIRFEGAVLHEEVVNYMNICDVFVSMNSLSSICNPVLEAMICGKSVIALNTGDTSDLIKDGYNGILVDVDEIENLPNCIVSILKDSVRRNKIGENAQRFMLERWPTWEERVNLEVDLMEALSSNDPEKFTKTKEKADSVLCLEKVAINLRQELGENIKC